MSSLVAEATVGAIASQEEPPSQWHLLGRLEKTTIGARGAGGGTKVRRREQAGCLLFGPYWPLRARPVPVSFRLWAGKPPRPGAPVPRVTVTRPIRGQPRR